MAEIQKIGSLLRNADIKFIRLTWCDTANIIRAKAVHVRNFESLTKEGFGLCTGVECLPVMYDVVCEGAGIGPVGEVRLIPKWDTLCLLPYSKGHARVFVDLYEHATNKPSLLCPREFLRRAVSEAAKEGVYVKAAFENEFLLLRPSEDSKDGYKLADDTLYCSTFSMDQHNDVITDIVEALTKQGVVVEAYYPESAPGQQEITMKYDDPLVAASQQVIFKETVKAVSHKHGYIATFVPKVIADQAGNGTHIHFSLHDKNGKNITPSKDKANEVSVIMGHFMAGVLEHLPGLMALTTPTTNSLRRVVPGAWCGAYRCWGYENREAAVRVPFNGQAPNPTHVELKTNDPASNPFLALGGLIAAGTDGIKRKLPLPPNTDFNPSTAPEELLKKNKIEILPRSLDVVIEALKTDRVLLDALQPPLAKAVIAIRNEEYRYMKDLSLEEEVKLLLNRY